MTKVQLLYARLLAISYGALFLSTAQAAPAQPLWYRLRIRVSPKSKRRLMDDHDASVADVALEDLETGKAESLEAKVAWFAPMITG